MHPSFFTMVNTAAFKKRLQTLLDHYELSATAFAEEVGVQRSSISHLLSGRNNPSLDFVLKVVQRFPEVNLYWFLNGKGSFPGTPETQPPALSAPATTSNRAQVQTQPRAQTQAQAQNATAKEVPHQGKQVEKIVVFFSDGSFREYHPSDE